MSSEKPVSSGLTRLGAMPSRSEAVLDAVKHAILTGRFRPGQALVETEIAELLGVSKTPVREAFKTLAGAGLVTMSPYKGAAVRVVDLELARGVYDLRLLLEPVAAARTAAAGRGDWEQARVALDRASRAPDAAERALANRAFHCALYAGCGNPLLVRTLDDLRDQTALISSAAWSEAPSWETEAREHAAILDAARAGDAELVRSLTHAHIAAFLERNFPDPDAAEQGVPDPDVPEGDVPDIGVEQR